MAPYFLPISTLLPLLLYPLTTGIAQIVLDVIIGFTYGFHIVGVIREFGSRQTDIQSTTYVFAWSLVVIMNALIFVVIIAVLVEDYAIIADFLAASWAAGSPIVRGRLEICPAGLCAVRVTPSN